MTKTDQCNEIINTQRKKYPEISKQQEYTLENLKFYETPQEIKTKTFTGEKICQTEIQFYKN